MNRQSWAGNWIKPTIDWFIQHSHRLDFAPKTRVVVDTWRDMGYRVLRKTAGISPSDLMPIGAIILWTGEQIPVGWEEINMQGAVI